MYVSSVVLCPVGAVRESDLKKRLTNDDQWKERHAVIRLMLLTGSIFYLLSVIATLGVGQLHPLEQGAAPSVLCCVGP